MPTPLNWYFPASPPTYMSLPVPGKCRYCACKDLFATTGTADAFGREHTAGCRAAHQVRVSAIRRAWRAQLPSVLDVPLKNPGGEPLPNVREAQSTRTCKPSEGMMTSTAARGNLWTEGLEANSKDLRTSSQPPGTLTTGIPQTPRSDAAGTCPAYIYIYIYRYVHT